MNKTELTAAVAQKAGLSKSDAAKVLGAFFETVSEELSKGQAVQIIGFGNFEVADYKGSYRPQSPDGRSARNPGWQASEVHRRLCAEEGCRRLIIA